MRTRTFVWAFVLLAVAAVLVIAIQRSRNPGVITVGAVLPLSGEGAKYGASARKAIDLAFSDVNAKGGIDGRKIEVIYEDSQGSPQGGVSALQKLVAQDRVPAVIGDLFSSVALAMSPICNRDRVVMLSPTATAPSLTKAGDYVFRNAASDVFEGRIMGEAARTRLGISRVGILYINNDYGVGISQVFQKEFGLQGGKVVAREAFAQGATDFRTQLVKVSASKPQAIYIVGYKELGPLLKQARELGIRTRFLSTVMFEDPEILAVAGDSAEGVVYSARAYDPESSEPHIRAFVQAYKARYGETPDVFAAYSYDSGTILAMAMKQSGFSSTDIKNALYKIQEFPGVCGATSFDKNGDVVQPAYLKTVKGHRFVWLRQD